MCVCDGYILGAKGLSIRLKLVFSIGLKLVFSIGLKPETQCIRFDTLRLQLDAHDVKSTSN